MEERLTTIENPVWFQKIKKTEWTKAKNTWNHINNWDTESQSHDNLFSSSKFYVKEKWMAGTYEFQFQVQVRDHSHSVVVRIKARINGKDTLLSQIFDDDQDEAGIFLTSIIELNQGDKVWVDALNSFNSHKNDGLSIWTGKKIASG